ncbi:MAG: hypothetical protein ACRER1_01595 [Gammaproteobacteria bacterium]
MMNMKVGIVALVLAASGFIGAPTARASISPAAQTTIAAAAAPPAGIADYSYIQVERINWGSSRYFGDSAKGNGAKFSFQFGAHAYVYGSYGRLKFDSLSGYLYRTGVGLGYAQTEGRLSAYVQIGYYREMLSASLSNTFSSARSYYFEPAYGMRVAFGRYFTLQGEIYSDLRPDFGSRPWGIKFGAAVALGPVSLHLVADHNRDVNALTAMLRFAF